MSFSSITFIFLFLPIALILYYISPKKAKNYVLFGVSLIFYALGEIMHLPVLLAILIVNYFCARGIEKFEKRKHLHRLMLAIPLVVTLGLLFVFKYMDFFSENINSLFPLNIPILGLALPLGIGFYALHALSYTLDVYRKNAYAESHFIDIALYMSFFPQLFPSTVVHYRDMNPQLRKRPVTSSDLDSGIEDFIIGLARKVIIANNLAVLWQEVNEIGLAAISTGLVWLSIVAFGLQIYFEFSGYAQMAVGLAKLFGFHLPKNFDDPYSANSITNFWRRWNISLGRWFREYIYIPLGGSRKKLGFTMLNLLLVWLLTGLWHGAALNFVIWGLYFFIFIIIERLGFQGFLNKHKILSRFYVVLVLLVGWAIFASTDFANMGLLLTKMFVPSFLNGDATVTIWYYLRNYAVTMLIAVFFSTSVSTKLYAKLRQNRVLRNIALILLFLACLAYLVEPALNPFRFMGF